MKKHEHEETLQYGTVFLTDRWTDGQTGEQSDPYVSDFLQKGDTVRASNNCNLTAGSGRQGEPEGESWQHTSPQTGSGSSTAADGRRCDWSSLVPWFPW